LEYGGVELGERHTGAVVMGLTSLVLKNKLYNHYGTYSDFIFTIKPSVKSLEVDSAVWIVLPPYYQQFTDEIDVNCLIDDV
jgi:hypothetical protein